ncbi:MAG: ABC transporter permease [Candidatus Moranbacteria bacterium]|nr:ABC transporter permease [Candidatus Moranbacteria bacterium]NTW45741.1 ABC transporter permease [Candidatus Moranbacteria bacterium]
MRYHENYRELIWMLAKTDFKLRYQGSFLGYVWALLKPLLTFAILNFVFSSIFAQRGQGMEHYSLQLLVGILMFNFFSEGTSAGMQSLVGKSQLVTKIYIPRWTIIMASTLNAAMIYLMNLFVVVAFFVGSRFVPSPWAVLMFALYSVLVYVIVLSFALLTAPLFVRFRDLSMIWEVLLQILFYATPVFYSLQLMPAWVQQVLLLNPIAFIIHFSKESLINGHFPELWQNAAFFAAVAAGSVIGIFSYRRLAPRVAEEM